MNYDIIVIGAGITGLSSAYHLKKRNPDAKILVVDKAGTYSQGNTAKSAAAFRDFFSLRENQIMAQASIAFYKNLQDKQGIDIGMKFCGYLFLFDHEKDEKFVSKYPNSRIITEDLSSIFNVNIDSETRKIMNIDSIKTAILDSNAGIIEPDLLSKYFFDQITSMGVDVRFNTHVKRLGLEPDVSLDYPGEPFNWQKSSIKYIETDREKIYGDFFILCTDVWTTALLDPVGIDSHLRPKKRMIFQVTSPGIREIINKNIFNDSGVFPFTIFPTGVYARPYPSAGAFWTSLADDINRDFSFTEHPEPEPEFYSYNIKPIFDAYFPAFQNSKITSSWAGYYSYNTIDFMPYIFNALNMVIVSGTTGGGIMKGDSIGRIVAARYKNEAYTTLYNGEKIENTYDGYYRTTKIEDMIL
ncbi:FAD-binding oxidoreductase [Acidiplasma cupricumulans]|jgi:glycine/D-amino acid oxidase-like deaminating enzyme|uniref:Oxidoreductase n=1 Tax=Acidiplasma cupricumulans TaxID=312540 RepID=A0A0Q0REG3_9ARCH|nr:FAD-binding oxidoreductase [Acidiplasma cupricumulans]KQB33445.1 oxidoreductase [Acidiplasma cupricumulans]